MNDVNYVKVSALRIKFIALLTIFMMSVCTAADKVANNSSEKVISQAPTPLPEFKTPDMKELTKNTIGTIHPFYMAGNRKPTMPSEAKRKGQTGTVVLRVLITENGKAGPIEISNSSGFESLDNAAIEAVKEWNFYPAMVLGKNINSWYQIPITFQISQ